MNAFNSPHLLYSRYNAVDSICQVQDYTFQLGQVLCTSTITFINAYIFYVLKTKKVPKEGKVKVYFCVMFFLCVVSVAITIVGDTSSMFCGSIRTPPTRSSNYENGTATQRLLLNILYLYPLVLMLFANIIFSCFSVFQMISTVSGSSSAHMVPLLQRLLALTLVVMFCGVPKAISFFFFDQNEFFAHMANTCIHSSGWIHSLFYFYYATAKESSSSQSRMALRQGMSSSSPENLTITQQGGGESDFSVSLSEFSRDATSEYSPDVFTRMESSESSTGTMSSFSLRQIAHY